MCSIEERIGAGRQDARILQAICWWHTDRYAKQNMCGEYSWDSQPVSLLRYVHHGEWKQWLLPFLGTQFFNRSSRLETKVYVKPTNTGLLLHYKSHANARYKRALPKTILDRAFRLSSNWSYFSEECDRLKLPFFRLKYSDKLIHSTISRFIATKFSDQPVSSPAAVSDSSDAVRVILPFLKTSPQLTLFDVNFRTWVTKFTRPCLQCLSAKKLSAILKCEKPSHLLSTSNVLFTNLNVTLSLIHIWRCRRAI